MLGQALLVSISLAGGSVLLLSGLYLLLLTIAGFWHRPQRSIPRRQTTRFALLVPAHNEEQTLPRLLESLQRVRYPQGLADVFVVADNCLDGTAAAARAWGATVFERFDEHQRGKGYALNWLLHQITSRSHLYDVYVLLDADCTVSENFLEVMDQRFQRGSRVVQSYYTVADPFKTHVSALRHVAMALKHWVRPQGRAILGLSCGLFGTGMAFRKDVIQEHTWKAYSLTEDIEYFLDLVDQGICIEFASEATVWSPMPGSFREARSQNVRWEKGRLQMLVQQCPGLVWKGVRRRDWRRIDAALEQAVPPLSVIAAAVVALLGLSVLAGHIFALAVNAAALAALAGHVFLGIRSAKLPSTVYRSFLFAPIFILWKVTLCLVSVLPGKSQWVRTPRS
ncbi:MAG: glycosyltransferase [Chloroflexi bacterium]|nr:glycosyltransferase [Chloroflexota bacterium]